MLRVPHVPMIFLIIGSFIFGCTALSADAALKSAASVTLNITKFGVKPDSRTNAVDAVQKALARANQLSKQGKTVTLVFPKGRYDFWPRHSVERDYYESNTYDINPKVCPILIEKISNLTIDAQGSLFVYHGQVQPITVDHSENITIKNVKIDWDIPLTAESKIVAVTKDSIDLQIDVRQFPYLIEKDKIVFVGEGWKSQWWASMEFDGKTRIVAPQSADHCLGGQWNRYRAEELKEGLVRLHYPFKRKPKVGNWFVMRHNTRQHAGIFLFRSKDIILKNVHVYHTNGLGILSQYTENLHFEQCSVEPNPDKNRYLSGHDDGMHFSGCKGTINIINCRFAGLMDDPINVHGTCLKIIKKLSPTKLTCRFMHRMSKGMIWGEVGDDVRLIWAKPMQSIAKSKIKTIKFINKRDVEIELTTPVPEKIQVGDAIENLTWSPSVNIQNCMFGSCRARGVLVSTPGKIVIENSTFESSGSAILIAGDSNGWYESGAVRDVLIRKNTFNAACLTSMYQFCDGIISIWPEIPKLDPALPCYHRNIRIEENTFHAFDYPVLFARSVGGLTFSKNRIIRSRQYKPWHRNKNMITLHACRAVTIKDNDIDIDALGRDIKLIETDQKELTVDPKQGLQIKVH